jgi:hypothetical protein
MRQFFVFPLLIITFCFLAALLTGCSEDEESSPTSIGLSTGTVKGTITLPASANGKTLWVILDKDTDGDNGHKALASCVCSYGLEYAYEFSNCPIGLYYIYAGVFTGSHDSGPPQEGDYFGFYGTGLEPPDLPNIIITTNKTITRSFDLYVVP